MNEAQIKGWFRGFKIGRTSVKSGPRSIRLATTKTPENVEQVRVSINQNLRLSVQEIEEDFSILKTIVSEISSHVSRINCAATKFVPWLLTEDQKNQKQIWNA